MNRVLCLLCALVGYLAVDAQVTIDAKLDSISLMVGEQTVLTLDVTAPSSSNIVMPVFQPLQCLVGDVEVVEQEPIDTVMVNDGKTMQLTKRLSLTSFCDHDTLYQLPPFVVEADGEQYFSRSLALKIFTLDVDTVHVDHFFPEKGIISPSIVWEDVRMIVWSAVLMLVLLCVTGFLAYRYKNGRPILDLRLRREKKLPPHQVAMNEINKIKAERKWADEDSKEYYTLLTDVLRTYMSERYGFNAMEMTSSEIIDHLLALDDIMLDELRQLFATADLVKFAKASTLIGENDMNLVNAVTYIQQTKLEEDPNAKPAPEPVNEEQRKHVVQRRVMIVGIIAGVTGVLAIMVYIAYRLWDLLS